MSNLPTDEISTPVMVEDIEVLKQENEDLKELLNQTNLMPGHFYAEIEKLKERNRQLRLKMSSERRDSIEKISELEHQVENMLRRNQAKQARLDELEIQIEEVTDSKLQNELSNLKAENANLRKEVEELEFLKKENESLKGLLDKKSSLALSDFYAELQKLRERNRQDRLEIGEKWRSSLVQISDLKHQLEGVTDSKLQNELSNSKTENANLRADYAALLESSTRETNKLRQEVQELRSQLETKRADREEIEKRDRAAIEAQRSQIKDLKRGYGLEPTHTENILRRQLADLQAELSDLKQKFVTTSELPEASDLLNRLKTRRKKSSSSLADVELILEMIEES